MGAFPKKDVPKRSQAEVGQLKADFPPENKIFRDLRERNKERPQDFPAGDLERGHMGGATKLTFDVYHPTQFLGPDDVGIITSMRATRAEAALWLPSVTSYIGDFTIIFRGAGRTFPHYDMFHHVARAMTWKDLDELKDPDKADRTTHNVVAEMKEAKPPEKLADFSRGFIGRIAEANPTWKPQWEDAWKRATHVCLQAGLRGKFRDPRCREVLMRTGSCHGNYHIAQASGRDDYYGIKSHAADVKAGHGANRKFGEARKASPLGLGLRECSIDSGVDIYQV